MKESNLICMIQAITNLADAFPPSPHVGTETQSCISLAVSVEKHLLCFSADCTGSVQSSLIEGQEDLLARSGETSACVMLCQPLFSLLFCY